MTVLIKGGTVVTADAEQRADVLCNDERIVAVGADRRPPLAGCPSGTASGDTTLFFKTT